MDSVVVAAGYGEKWTNFFRHISIEPRVSWIVYEVLDQAIFRGKGVDVEARTREDVELPDVGRESAVYLRYIVENYEDLPLWIVFTQLDPIPHRSSGLRPRKPATPKFIPLACEILTSGPFGEPHHWEDKDPIPVGALWARYRSDPFPPCEGITFHSAGIFMVHRDRILKNPIGTYEDMLEQVSQEKDPPEGYAFERLWGEIFDESSVWEVQDGV